MAPPPRPAMSMADFASEIAELGEYRESLNWLIYGDPGVGKTGLVAAAPDSLLLACDPGFITAKQLGYKCQVRPVKDSRTLEAGLSWLEDDNARNYRYVLLEGLSVLNTRLIQEYAKEAWVINPEKRANAYQPDKPDYFRAQNAIKSAVARLVDLPVDVIITAHAIHGEDDEGESWIRPHIEGRGYQVGNYVTSQVNVIGYMAKVLLKDGSRKGEQGRRILWQQFQNKDGVTFMAKDQTNSLGLYTDDISWAEVQRLSDAALARDGSDSASLAQLGEAMATSGSNGRAAKKTSRRQPVQVRRAE